MQVFIERTNETKELGFEGTVSDLLVILNINTEDVLVVRENTLLTPDIVVSNADALKLLSVVSGG